MDYITITNLDLNFPYMIGILETREKRRVNIREVVEDFKNNKYISPHIP